MSKDVFWWIDTAIAILTIVVFSSVFHSTSNIDPYESVVLSTSLAILIFSLLLTQYGDLFVQRLALYKESNSDSETDRIDGEMWFVHESKQEDIEYAAGFIPTLEMSILSTVILSLLLADIAGGVNAKGQIYPVLYQMLAASIIIRERFHGNLGTMVLHRKKDLQVIVEGVFGFSLLLTGFSLNAIFILL